MPSLGADMEFGTVLKWLVKPGDAVKRGDVVAVVDTSKAEIDVEIFEDGVIGELLIPVGERVPVGTALATILPAGTNGAKAPAQSVAPLPPVQVEVPSVPVERPPERAAPPAAVPLPPLRAPAERRARVSPLARRLGNGWGSTFRPS